MPTSSSWSISYSGVDHNWHLLRTLKCKLVGCVQHHYPESFSLLVLCVQHHYPEHVSLLVLCVQHHHPEPVCLFLLCVQHNSPEPVSLLVLCVQHYSPEPVGLLVLCVQHHYSEFVSLLVQGLLQSGSAPEVAELLKLICKAFWSATYMGIPDTLLQQDQFVGWMTCIHALMEMPVPKVLSSSG